MDINSDYRDLFRILNKHKVKYLVVGAYAVIYYTEPRYTKDLDVWIKVDPKNAERVYLALKEFGAPLKGITVEDFNKENLVYQIGMAPIRVDIIMGLGGIRFDSAWGKRVRSKYADVRINIISKDVLVRAKKKTKRKQDVLDLEKLI